MAAVVVVGGVVCMWRGLGLTWGSLMVENTQRNRSYSTAGVSIGIIQKYKLHSANLHFKLHTSINKVGDIKSRKSLTFKLPVSGIVI